ncbi:hypothetical protein FOA52_002090 [Chlamydomonas sp. UWO 241]|nr:hypothetical protein FOA52_002090 [Chlamydomonas sp. UWO 241]
MSSTLMKGSSATGSLASSSRSAPSTCRVTASAMGYRSRAATARVVCSVSQQTEGKTVIVKNQTGDLPFPWSEKDPYKLPVSIDRVQKLLLTQGWEKPWVEQIVDRIMKGMLRTSEERALGVIDYLCSVGLKTDEVCNMASISVVLLGLNPETRLKPVVQYLMARGVPAGGVPDLLLKHPRMFEYIPEGSAPYLVKGKARIQVDVLPLGGAPAAAVNYFRENASFNVSPVAPSGPMLP